MIQISQGFSLDNPLHAAMFADRKRVFVDILGWDVPIVDDRFEIDQFDGDDATYIVADNGSEGHRGSMRLLPTVRPHILGTLFAHLCDGPVPRGGGIAEITRLCLPSQVATERRAVRDTLISAMVDHCLANDVTALTGVVRWGFLEQICAMGWRCAPLGPPCRVDGVELGAFRIDLDADTPALLAATGIYRPVAIAPVLQAA